MLGLEVREGMFGLCRRSRILMGRRKQRDWSRNLEKFNRWIGLGEEVTSDMETPLEIW